MDMSATLLLQQLRNKLQLVLKDYGDHRKQILLLQKEQDRLRKIVAEKQEEIERLNDKIAAKDLNRLTSDSGSKKELEIKINSYLKEIDKCLALLKT